MLKLFTSFFILVMSLSARAQVPMEFYPWHFNSTPTLVLKDDASNRLYVAGPFTTVYPQSVLSPNGTSVNATTGAIDFTYANPNGEVQSAISDGNGGWFIGGTFTRVGGLVRNQLAHLNSNGQVTDWDPNVGLVGQRNVPGVKTLILSGNALYFGGSFDRVNGQERNNLAAVDVTSGEVLSFNPNIANEFVPDFPFVQASSTVNKIVLNGNILYVGGHFTRVGGTTILNHLAAIDITTGLAIDNWHPDPQNDVNTMLLIGTILYVGGNFNSVPDFFGDSVPSIGGEYRNYLAALDASTGIVLSWNPQVSGLESSTGRVDEMIAVDNTIYIGGSFDSVGTMARNNLAAIDATSGIPTSWNPSSNAINNSSTDADITGAFALDVNVLYVSGSFDNINGEHRNRLAAIDINSGQVLSWNPASNGPINIRAIAVNDNAVYIGGVFAAWGTGVGTTRNGILALDAATGALLPFNSGASLVAPNGTIRDMVLKNNMLYLGGTFTEIAGQTRNRLAAINVITDQLANWNPDVTGGINDLTISGDTLYIAGSTALTVGGIARSRVAAINLQSGNLTDWNPTISSGAVNSIAANSTTVYIGGTFTNVNGTGRNRLAAISTSGTLVTTWNPNSAAAPNRVLLDGNTLYAGGVTTIGGAGRNRRVVAIDASTGIPTTWEPLVDNITAGSNVTNIAINDNGGGNKNVYLGGTFKFVGSIATPASLTAINANSGTVSSWYPDLLGGTVNTINVSDDILYVAGNNITANNLLYPLQVGRLGIGPLPVRFTDIFAKRTGKIVDVNWQVAEEKGIAIYEVERSVNGEEFVTIGSLNAGGNEEYLYLDTDPYASVNYYRIKAVEHNGGIFYSKIVHVNGIGNQGSVNIYPNPVSGKNFQLLFNNLSEGRYDIRMYNINGRLVKHFRMDHSGNANSVSMDVSDIAPGVYEIKEGRDNNWVLQQKMIKL